MKIVKVDYFVVVFGTDFLSIARMRKIVSSNEETDMEAKAIVGVSFRSLNAIPPHIWRLSRLLRLAL